MELLKLRKRKGISPLIATLLLIAIAVAASVLTYSWVMSMIGSQSAQAQTQVRIDSVTWGASHAATMVLDVRNTGSVDATLESVSIRKNAAGSTALVLPVSTAIGAGTHSAVPATGTLSISSMSPVYAASTSYVIRVTTNTGFYYEAVFTSPA
jgi:flagellin-like protein